MVTYGACTQERSSLEKDMVQGAAFAVAIGCIVYTSVYASQSFLKIHHLLLSFLVKLVTW